MFKCFGLAEYELILQIPGKRRPVNVLRDGKWKGRDSADGCVWPCFHRLHETRQHPTVSEHPGKDAKQVNWTKNDFWPALWPLCFQWSSFWKWMVQLELMSQGNLIYKVPFLKRGRFKVLYGDIKRKQRNLDKWEKNHNIQCIMI